MTIGRDVRFGLRRLRRTPLFSLAVLVTLAVAIAANVAVFSAVRAILLRPLPIQHPDRVVFLQETGAGRGQPIAEVSHRNFVDWRAQSQSFESMAAISSTTWSSVMDRHGEPVRIAYAAVSGSFFDLLGVSAQLGRTFMPADDIRGAARVLILSDGLWRRVFHVDPHVIGTQVPIGDTSFTIVGVMSPQFAYPAEAAAWTPVVPALEAQNAHWKLDTLEKRFFGMLNVVGRLKPGVSQEQARAELDTIVRRLPEVDPRQHVGSAVIVTPLLDHIFGPTRRGLILLFAMVCLVLFIACANVASLVLARAATLRGVFAIKSALGASRAQLVREWVVEIGLVTLASSMLGIFLAWVTLKPLLAIAPSSLPHLDEARIDLPVLAFALGLCLITMVLCAFVPAIIASARGAREARLQTRLATGPGPLIGRGLLTAMQIALATVLLTGAGLLVRSFDQLRRIDPGFEPRHLLTLGVEPQAKPDGAYRIAYDAILARVASLPGVEAVGAVSNPPLAEGHVGDDNGYLLEGQGLTTPEAKNNAMLNFEAVTPGYFAAMRIAVHRGRVFSARDTADTTSVAIVSESTARRLWPGQEAVGKRLTIPAGSLVDGQYPAQTVIGVVADVRYRGLDDDRFDIYMSTAQTRNRVRHLMIRTANDPTSVAASVRAAIGNASGTRVLVESIDTMDRTMADAIAPWRFSMTLLAGLAIIGVLLAIAGLFALVAYAVVQRTPEFAIRLAIGAEPMQVLRMVLWQAAYFAVPGLIVGLMLSLIATNRMASLLFQVSARDVPTFTIAGLLLGGTALFASYLAARRVIRIDPLAALRSE